MPDIPPTWTVPALVVTETAGGNIVRQTSTSVQTVVVVIELHVQTAYWCTTLPVNA